MTEETANPAAEVTETTLQVVANEPVPALPEPMTIVTIGLVSAVVTWGVVEIVRTLFRGGKEEPQWYYAAIRLGSMIVGAIVGSSLFASLGYPPAPWGTAVGAGSGALCTVIVAAVKSMIKRRGEGGKA